MRLFVPLFLFFGLLLWAFLTNQLLVDQQHLKKIKIVARNNSERVFADASKIVRDESKIILGKKSSDGGRLKRSCFSEKLSFMELAASMH